MSGTVYKSCLTKLVCSKFFRAKGKVKGKENGKKKQRGRRGGEGEKETEPEREDVRKGPALTPRPPTPAHPLRGGRPSPTRTPTPAAKDSASQEAADGRPPAATSGGTVAGLTWPQGTAPRGLGAAQARRQGPPLRSEHAGPALASVPGPGAKARSRSGEEGRAWTWRQGGGHRGHQCHLQAPGRTASVAAEHRGGRRPIVGVLGGDPRWRRPCPCGWGRQRRGAWRVEPQRLLAARPARNQFRLPPGGRYPQSLRVARCAVTQRRPAEGGERPSAQDVRHQDGGARASGADL